VYVYLLNTHTRMQMCVILSVFLTRHHNYFFLTLILQTANEALRRVPCCSTLQHSATHCNVLQHIVADVEAQF